MLVEAYCVKRKKLIRAVAAIFINGVGQPFSKDTCNLGVCLNIFKRFSLSLCNDFSAHHHST